MLLSSEAFRFVSSGVRVVNEGQSIHDDSWLLHEHREVWLREMLPTLQEEGKLHFRGVVGGVPSSLAG